MRITNYICFKGIPGSSSYREFCSNYLISKNESAMNGEPDEQQETTVRLIVILL